MIELATPPDPDRMAAVDEWYVPPVPDAVDLVLEAATMVSVFAAQRLARIEAMRREEVALIVGGGSGTVEVAERSIRLELAASLRITEHAAGRLMMQAEALINRYPRTWDALSGGRITERHAEIFVDLVDQVAPELRAEVVDRALLLAEAEPVGTFRRELRELIGRVEATTLDERFEAAVRQRRLVADSGDDGMGLLLLHAPAVAVQAIFGRATAMAKTIASAEGEARTLDQIRADVVSDLLIDGTTTHLPAAASGIRASVVVTVPVLSLLDDAAGAVGTAGAARAAEAPSTVGDPSQAAGIARAQRSAAAGDPPVVEGIGPIPLAQARELCGGDARWMRVLTHPETGMVLSVGRDQYSPPPALRKLVKWRADRCMAPGCGMPASRCEIDHQVAWVEFGETSLENNAPLCKGHHTVKHHGGWAVRQINGSGGAVEWTSPTGRRYTVQPKRRVPVFTVTPSSGVGNDPPPF